MTNNMEKEQIKKIIDERISDLLSEYHHYLFMTKKNPFKGWFAGMSIGGFMNWLKSKNKEY